MPWMFVVMSVFIDWMKRIRKDDRYEQQWKPNLDDDFFFFFREQKRYCIFSVRPWFSPLDVDIIKLVSIWTNVTDRHKGIATRCMRSMMRYLDNVNSERDEQDRGIMLLFPVPFQCGWHEDTRFDGTSDMIGYADDSGHLGPFPEYLHYRTWTELRDWYDWLGFQETDKPELNIGKSIKSKQIGRKPMVYPSLD